MLKLYEYWNISDPALANLYSYFWQGQTFTPREPHTVKLLKLMMYRYGLPGIVGVSIRATNGNHLPQGDDLIYVTFDGNLLPTVYTSAKAEVPLGDGLALDEDSGYAIIARAINGNLDNYVRWRFQRPSSYPRGAHVFSSDSGETWEYDTTRDMRFEEWGE
jgi:hypothetical protein